MSNEIPKVWVALDQTLAWSKAQSYLEHTKHDALNSPFLTRIFGGTRYGRIFATQVVMRFPFNLRGALGVRKSHNPKGLALFVLALLDSFAVRGQAADLAEAERLLEILLTLRSRGAWKGDCWGYQYPWQDLGFFAPAGTPNAVVSAFVCEAFLKAHAVTGKRHYLDVVSSCAEFLLNDLALLKSTDEELCLGYMPLGMSMRVMDVSILVAAVLAQLHHIEPAPHLAATAMRLTRFVVRCQTADGAWYYTDPPQDSPVKIDNYHTGFILDALLRVMQALGTREWQENYQRGVAFYASQLFNADGSPRWMSDQNYPHDIHGAAQGILTFSQPQNLKDYPGLAAKIMDWALVRMYHPEGRFYYQETRFYTKKFTFIRWCNAWMCLAMATHILNRQT